MKGITPVISVILLLLVTIAIVGLASGFFQRIFGLAGTGIDQQLNASTAQFGQTVKIDGAAGTSVVLRHTGSKTIDLSSVRVFLDNAPATCTWSSATLAPGGTVICTLESACTGKTVKASAPGGDAPGTVTC